jgi:two-component sensor histidine kinase
MKTCYVENHRTTAELVRKAFAAELCTIQTYTTIPEKPCRFVTSGPEERLKSVIEEVERLLGYSLSGRPPEQISEWPEIREGELYMMPLRCEERLMGHMMLLGADERRFQSRCYTELLEHHLRVVLAMEAELKIALRREEELHMRQREAHHRMKNSLQTVTGLLSLQAREADDELLTARLNEAAGRIRSVQLLYERLSTDGHQGALSPRAYFTPLVTAVLEAYSPDPPVSLELDIDDKPVDSVILSPLGLVVNELVSNAVDHAFTGVAGRVLSFRLVQTDGSLRLTVRDNGRGLPADFDSRDDATTGLGTTIVRFLVERLDGTVTYRADDGTAVEIDVPLT